MFTFFGLVWGNVLIGESVFNNVKHLSAEIDEQKGQRPVRHFKGLLANKSRVRVESAARIPFLNCWRFDVGTNGCLIVA
jgi:hypothetical protein